MQSYIFILIIATLPIHEPNIDLGFMSLKVFQILTLLHIAIFLSTKKKVIPLQSTAPIVLFLIFIQSCFLSTTSSIAPTRSLNLTFAISFCFLFFASSCFFIKDSKHSVQTIKKTLLFSNSIYSLYGVTQLLLFFSGRDANVNFKPWDVVPRVPYFSAENVHAAYALIATLFLFHETITNRIRPHIGIPLIVLNVGGIVATGTRSAFLCLFIGVIAIILSTLNQSKKAKRNTLATLALSVPLVWITWDILFIRLEAVFSGGDSTTAVRLDHYIEIFSFFQDRIATGIGLGGALTVSKHDVHNLPLMVLFETGMIGLCSYFAFAMSCAVNAFKRRAAKSSLFNKRETTLIIIVSGCTIVQAFSEPSLYFFHIYLMLALLAVPPPTRNVRA